MPKKKKKKKRGGGGKKKRRIVFMQGVANESIKKKLQRYYMHIIATNAACHCMHPDSNLIYLCSAALVGGRHKSLILPKDNNYVIRIPRWSCFRSDAASQQRLLLRSREVNSLKYRAIRKRNSACSGPYCINNVLHSPVYL